MNSTHDPLHMVSQLRQTLSADKLSVGFFLGAGCPCAVRVHNDGDDKDRPIIPDIRGLTTDVTGRLAACPKNGEAFKKLKKVFEEDGVANPNVEVILNTIRSLRDVAGKSQIRQMSYLDLDNLDRGICEAIREAATCNLPDRETPYHALAHFVRVHRYPASELFTTNYDLLMEQALEAMKVPYFDGFVGSWRPFFDQRAIEDDRLADRWSRLWKLHGSINWRLNKSTRAIFRSENVADGDELLIHPSHLKYDESRRMPYFIMIDRLIRFLRNSEKPVALIIIGYSFGDEHVNEAIVESIKVNASAACFALQYKELADYPQAKKLALDNANLSLFASDAGVVRRKEGVWMARPTCDVSSLKCAFELIGAEMGKEKGEVVESADGSDDPKPCRFICGDFARFGDFLDEFSRYGKHGQ